MTAGRPVSGALSPARRLCWFPISGTLNLSFVSFASLCPSRLSPAARWRPHLRSTPQPSHSSICAPSILHQLHPSSQTLSTRITSLAPAIAPLLSSPLLSSPVLLHLPLALLLTSALEHRLVGEARGGWRGPLKPDVPLPRSGDVTPVELPRESGDLRWAVSAGVRVPAGPPSSPQHLHSSLFSAPNWACHSPTSSLPRLLMAPLTLSPLSLSLSFSHLLSVSLSVSFSLSLSRTRSSLYFSLSLCLSLLATPILSYL